jgi:adenosylhomocysteine nucleosidase
MEAGAVAQVAQSFGVPYIIVRCLSDVVHHNENPMEFSEYAQKASIQSAGLIQAFAQKL